MAESRRRCFASIAVEVAAAVDEAVTAAPFEHRSDSDIECDADDADDGFASVVMTFDDSCESGVGEMATA